MMQLRMYNIIDYIDPHIWRLLYRHLAESSLHNYPQKFKSKELVSYFVF